MSAWVLGACCFVAVGSAEDLEPSAAGAAPGASPLAVSAFATPSWDGEALLAGAGSEPLYARRWRRPRYREEGERREWRRAGPDGWLTLRGGFFDTEGVDENDWLVGLKASAAVARAVDLGVSVDLHRRSDSVRDRVEEFRDPAGNLVRTTVTTFESSSNLIPILGVLEFRLPTPGGIQPYFGVGAGYEILVVDGEDFITGDEFEETFDGFGWQGFAGISVPLGSRTRLVGEGFFNRGTVDRTDRDPVTGDRVKQEIDVDGGGLRAGFAFGL